MPKPCLALLVLAASLLIAAAPLPLLDEAGDLSRWKGLAVNTDRAFIKEGAASARWVGAEKRSFASIDPVPSDWSTWNALSFWVHSAVSNGAVIAISIGSTNQHPGDGYFKLVTLDWQGWRQLVLPLSTFSRNRSPKGWGAVTSFTLMTEGYGAKSKPDTVLFIDAMRLETLDAATLKPLGALELAPGSASWVEIPVAIQKRFPVVASTFVFPQGGNVRGAGVLARYERGPGEIWVRRSTQRPLKEPFTPIATVTVFDPDGNRAAFHEFTDQSPVAEQQLRIESPRAGIWRVSFAGGRAGDQVDFALPATPHWGLRGEMALGVTPLLARTNYLYLPRTLRELVLTSTGEAAGLALFDDEGKEQAGLSPADRRNVGVYSRLRPQRVVKLVLDSAKVESIAIDGAPGLLCPSAEAAEVLKGGTVEAEGILCAGPLQARARRWMLKQAGKNYDPKLVFPTDLPTHIVQPRVEALVFGKYGPLAAMKASLACQVLDPASPWFGAFLPAPKAGEAPRPSWDGFLWGPVVSPFDAGNIANAVRFEGRLNPARGNEALTRRALLAALFHVVQMSGEDLFRENDLRASPYPITHVLFTYEGALVKAYRQLRDLSDPEVRAILEQAVLAVGVKLADFQAYQSNQWMHVIRGHLSAYLSTGRKEFLGWFERLLGAFLANAHGPASKFGQHPAGFFLEEAGPDGNYDHLSSFCLVADYHDYRLLPEARPELVSGMRTGIEKNLHFKSFWWLPQPSGEMRCPTGANHRTTGSLGSPSYPGDHMAQAEFPAARARFLLSPDPKTGPGAGSIFSHLAHNDDWARRVIAWGLEKKDMAFESTSVYGAWLDDLEKAFRLPNQATPATIPCQQSSGRWWLPGQAAYKHRGVYGLVFYDVAGAEAELKGKMGGGPTALWCKSTGLIVAGMNDPKKTGLKPGELTHACVFGMLENGKPFVSGTGADRSSGAWNAESNRFTVDTPLKAAPFGVRWSHRLDERGVTLQVELTGEEPGEAWLALPLAHFESETQWTLSEAKGEAIQKLGNGQAMLRWPPGIEARLEETPLKELRRLVLRLPAKGGLSMTVTAKD
jgi:hypothetical protein